MALHVAPLIVDISRLAFVDGAMVLYLFYPWDYEFFHCSARLLSVKVKSNGKASYMKPLRRRGLFGCFCGRGADGLCSAAGCGPMQALTAAD
jgi:hypothetical protein